MYDFQWLNFSDLHLNPHDNFDTLYARNKLIQCLSESNFVCDYIFLTGDLADRGNYDSSMNFILELLSVVKVPMENIFWAVGNHDISRTHVIRNNIIHEIREGGVNKYSSIMLDWERRNILTVLGMRYYNDNYYRLFHRAISLESAFRAHIFYPLKELNLIVLNTCLTSCDNEDAHQLAIMEPSLLDLFKDIDRSKPTFVLGHHGKDFFHTEEQKKLGMLFDDIGVDFYLCGHAHRLGYELFGDAQRNIHQFTCGGGIPDNYSVFSFMHGQYSAENHLVHITPYSYSDKGSRIWNVDYHLHRRLTSDNCFAISRLEPNLKLLGRHDASFLLHDFHFTFMHYIKTAKIAGKAREISEFRAVNIPFSCDSRKKELNELIQFCQSDKAIEWWCITGKGGSGKSRLALEACQYVQENGWEYVFMTRSFFENRKLDQITEWNYNRNLLVVVDYASHFASDIAEWFQILINSSFDYKLRILLIDRNVVNKYIEPLWLMELRRGVDRNLLYQSCFDPDKYSLELTNLTLEDCRTFLKNYFNSINCCYEQFDIDHMLQEWGEDTEYRRPLYLLFLADAWSETGNSKIWNAIELQNYIYNKEINLIKAKFKNEILGNH